LLVTAQICLSVILLVCAGLLIRSFFKLQNEPPGFDRQGVLTMHMALPPTKYATSHQMIEFFDRLLDRVQATPAVEAAAVSSALPLEPARMSPALIEGQPVMPLAQRPMFVIQTLTPPYLRVMKIPLIRGRFVTNHDTSDSLPVVVVNQALVRKYFGNDDPVGKHVWVGRRTTAAEIVGVIGDVKNIGLSEGAQPEIDLPFTQLPWAGMNLLVRVNGEPKALSSTVRSQIQKIDADLPVTSIQTLDELLIGASSQPQLMMLLLTVFAVSTFALAIVGLYSLISNSVSQRAQEVGIRIALGADHSIIVGMLVREGALLAAIGIAAGLVASYAATGLLSKLIYGVTTKDPLTFVLTPVLFMAFALLASYVPALRATNVDPAEALRSE
jgi:putative ABC transport system permease protein